MIRVDIYVEASKRAPQKLDRKTCCILECRKKNGNLHTKEMFFRENGTYHEAILKTLVTGLNEIVRPSEIHIHTQDEYVLQSIDHNMESWAENGWKNKEGREVKNAEEWRRIWAGMQGHLVATESGSHSYHAWMMSEMDRRE